MSLIFYKKNKIKINSKNMSEKPQEIFLKDYKVPNFNIQTVDLHFRIEEDQTIVRNIATFIKNSKSEEKNNLRLEGINLELLSLKLDDKLLTSENYDLEEEFLILKNVPENFKLESEVKIKPHENKELMGLYKSDNIFCTQNEPQGFRRITFHPDRSDILSTFTTTIIADKNKYPVLLSNGNMIKSGDLENDLHFVVWEDPIPKPNYLFALVAGDLVMKEDSFTTMSGKKVPLQIFTEQKDIHRVDHAMESLIKSMKWDEDRFGREYDLDIYMIVAVDAFNSGAMENKGLNIFNSSAILCDAESSTDCNYQYIERVIAHEYFHNWTGNRITCRDWFQLTLKEGLTVFRDAEFSSDMGNREVKRIADAAYLKENQFPEDAGPMAHPIQPQSFIQIENFYTRTVYDKGSEVIRMLITMLGKDGFRKGMDKYFELFDGQAVTTQDFIKAFEITSGRDFTKFKESWYVQAGTPHLSFTEDFDEKAQTYTLNFKQTCPFPENKNLKPFHFPIEIGLISKNGKELASKLFELDAFEDSITFKNISESPIPSVLRDFSAPVKIVTELGLEKDLILFKHDSDDYNRYEAGQKIDRKMIGDLMNIPDLKIPEQILESYKKLLNDETLSHGFRAESLSLPGLYTLVEPNVIYDYSNAYNSRKAYANMIADFMEDDLLAMYKKLNDGKKYSKDLKSMEQRSLKNACLTYLYYATKDYTDLIYTQFEKADNMTDQMASLSLLCHGESEAKEKALKIFEDKWKDDPLVMNKWFSVQANGKSEKTLENIKKLENHPSFDKTNPNKIRSLFGAFGRNFPFFHSTTGEGYKYLADKIIETDIFNKKAASGLARVFDQYKHLNPEQKNLKKLALDKILQQEKISDALFEIVSKIKKSGE